MAERNAENIAGIAIQAGDFFTRAYIPYFRKSIETGGGNLSAIPTGVARLAAIRAAGHHMS
ncbi:MAG: hypothetical protein JW862_15825 [Anaerolineales bacterium]|nr:hypothetical protein [Anaerolineales bacterium]